MSNAPLPILLARLATTLETARLNAAFPSGDPASILRHIEQAQRELEAVREQV